MIEQTVSILGAAIIGIATAMRLNELYYEDRSFSVWRVLEVAGFVGLLAGCAGVIGEWFLDNVNLRAETIVIVSMALVVLGVSRLKIGRFVGYLRGWDGIERRLAERARRDPMGRA